jgi:hypothetical protein
VKRSLLGHGRRPPAGKLASIKKKDAL